MMNDPFHREFPDGTTFDAKSFGTALVAGAILAAVAVPVTIKWQNTWYERQELKKKIKNKITRK